MMADGGIAVVGIGFVHAIHVLKFVAGGERQDSQTKHDCRRKEMSCFHVDGVYRDGWKDLILSFLPV